ncbi:ABC transporter permease [Streptomyces sp. NPDC051776]|uniref:ABC transporter permease n=1 Tax=Streptomyces sp. NPDC051776 TaxID=3155414 RepID=UPI00343F59EE
MPNLASFRQLSLTSARELARDPVNIGMSIVFPLGFILLFTFLPDVAPAPGAAPVDSLVFGLPAVLLLAMTSLATTGTAVPLTVLRQRGVLRAVGLTPVTRLAFVTALVPARAVVVGAELVLVGAMASAGGALNTSHPVLLLWTLLLWTLLLWTLLLWTLLLCCLTLTALGYFLGGLFASPELVTPVLGLAVPVVLILSGVLLPVTLFPSPIAEAAEFLPFTYMGDLLRHTLTGLPAQYSTLYSSGLLLLTSAVLTGLTAITFRWQERER